MALKKEIVVLMRRLGCRTASHLLLIIDDFLRLLVLACKELCVHVGALMHTAAGAVPCPEEAAAEQGATAATTAATTRQQPSSGNP